MKRSSFKKEKIFEEKEEMKKVEPQEEIRAKIEKLNFREGEKQADEVLKMHVSEDVTFTKN